ncbi:ATP-binding protein [Klenkia sp. PcliD-1-E]|uniref:ATP-binding protein n=1 Tax=Klenkia sp. PcliD-1-E TaxID=2954492 RepID=UPI00209750E0|nr:ATP-binding protein [Klenkia sp. PcliD-1-E]MCO7219246.1 ATP-binding protein [Klenkia sp. PcliD-1-E]
MGAPESNAGDDFHFWWAASRALALIEPGTENRLLVIEGLAPVDDPDDEYEIVDVAEYLGGADFASATTILISQLKYSTRHPDRAWTAAQITRKRSRRGKDAEAKITRSVIRDLADTYAQLMADHGRDAVAGKVRIRLVSNQPGDPLLTGGITAAASWAREQGPGAKREAMLKALPDQESQVIRQLSEAVGPRLTSADFCDFITVLDLSETGALDRAALARSVRAGAAELSPGRGPDSGRRLFDLVRQQALPESRREGLTAADILAELDVADLLDLYPAPPRLAELSDPLASPGACAVAEAATAHLGEIVVAHGPAGAGKTTAVRQAVDHLPHGSTMILYDCYGGGDYLSAGEERHTPPRFVMQVANDLAQRCGTPLLLHPPALDADLWRHLSRRLSRAVETLPPGAVLVLAVDAADNAAVAAAERGDPCFLPGLLALPLPPQVTVVLTTRSHRIDITGAADAPKVDVLQFDAPTSATHLRRHRPDASNADTAAFHERTGGNPRVQFYVLEQAASNDWDMPALLAACSRTPEPLFADLMDSALKGSGAGAGGQRWLALMLALARPVSIGTLADALDVDAGAVSAFADGLTPGVAVLKGAIQFRDEDFETFVRGRVDPDDVVTAHGRLADLFLPRRTDDADAAAHVAEHLFAAARNNELLQLVLNEDSPRGIADGFRREQVQGRRLDLAVRAAADADDAAIAVRVAARACDTASRLDTLSRLVEAHLDLVARYADVDLLRTYALKQSRGTWLGPVQMRLAAALSRDPERQTAAREALDSADAWVHRWMAGREDETRHWGIEADDVAGAAEAHFRLDGVDAAVASLRRWRPVSFALEAAASLAGRVAGEVGPDSVRAALGAAGIPALVQAPFLAHAATPTANPDPDWIDIVVAALVARTSDKSEPWHARLLDTVVRHGSKEAAGALVRRWKRDLPASTWSFRTPGSDGVRALRCHAVAAALADTNLDVNALVPASLQPGETKNGYSHDPHGRERGEWIQSVGSLGAVAVLAARAAAGDDVRDSVVEEVDGALTGRLQTARHRWFKYDTSFRTWASFAAEAVVDADAPADLLDRIASAAPELVRDGAPELWLDLADMLAARPRHTDRAADLAMRATAAVRNGAYPAPDRLDLLARAADIAGGIAPALGRQLFEHAIEAATGINDDAARLLSVHADLARRATLMADQRTQVAAKLVRAAEDVAPHVTDPDVVPHEAVAGAASHLDAAVGLAAVSRWDDEARVRMATTLPPALLGAVDGGAISAADALALDNLIEDDGARLSFQLALIEQMPVGDAGTVAARRATARASSWLRHHVPARLQPAFARRLLDESADRALDATVRAELEATREVTPPKNLDEPATWSRPWAGGDPAAPVRALLDAPGSRSWTTLAEDVTLLMDAHVYGEQLRSFVAAVLLATPPMQRPEALAAFTEIPGWRSVDTVLPVLAEYVGRWREWPGVREWAAGALPNLLERHLVDLVAWPVDVGPLVAQLRGLVDDDDVIRRAVLEALPGARPQLTAQGWQNIAALLGRLCPPADAASAVVGLLADRTTGDSAGQAPTVATEPGPIVMLLWSAFGHPRREIRWRAAHAVRHMLTRADPVRAADFTARLIGCLDLVDVGQYRDQELHFYRLSALAALLTALARVAADKPALLEPHVQTLIRIATSRDLPHAQIRELARSTALAVTEHLGAVPDELRHVNRPVSCAVDREHRYVNDRQISDDRRYRFDQMDTIPYWYAPLARVFGVETDAIAERAERWILDEWSRSEDDWMTDVRELRDERSYRQMHNDHGSIPPEENLRLYLEYHAMLVTAGELVDAGTSVHFDPWEDAPDPWQDWLQQHLPTDTEIWLSDLRAPVPVEPGLFGHLPPLGEWETPEPEEYDRAFGLVDGGLPETVIVAGSMNVSRAGAYGDTYISSALVLPDNAADLQRALVAASNPRHYKLPDEGDDRFEIDHGVFALRGWLTGAHHKPESLDEHDPYAHGVYKAINLPGRRFRDAAGARLDPTGLALLSPEGNTVARAEQWADPQTEDPDADTSSGYRVRVDRATLLHHLADSGTNLIVEVQIGRHRRNRGRDDEYRPPRSRIYLVDATGDVTIR